MVRKLEAPKLPSWLARELPFERYCVALEDHRVHVMEGGDPGGRPVFMLHGNPTWGFLWRKIARELTGERLRLIMPDVIGLGLSDKPRDPGFHRLARHGELMAQLVAALALRDVVFVGQDWGGPIGLLAFANEPARLTGMVLLNTVIGPPRPGFRPTAFHRFAHMPVVSELVFRGLGFPQTALWTVQGDKLSIRGTAARAYRYPLRSLRDNVAPLALARMVPDSLEHPSIPALTRAQTVATGSERPTELVWGDRDPVLGGVRSHIQRLLPNAHVTQTSAGHFLQEEVPGPIAAAIRRVASR